MKLSVIIPGYNNPDRWWQRCVDSVIAAGADEIICVDDGSSVQPKFSTHSTCSTRLKILNLPHNVGLASARNAGLAEATGDYIAFVDSDDEVRPQTFEICKKSFEETNVDIAVYGVEVVWTAEGLKKVDSFEKFECYEKLTPLQVRFLHSKNLFNYSCNKIYRRAFLLNQGLRFDKDGVPCEDFIFNVKCLMAGASYCFVPYAGYVYYRRQNTLVARYNASLIKGIRIQDQVAKAYKQTCPEAIDVLKGWGEMSASQLDREEWRNAWLPGTPYSLMERWRIKPGIPFFKMMIFMFVRQHLYFRPLRRMNLRRAFPNVMEWKES